MSTRTITGEAPTPRARLASPRRLLRLRSDAALAERYAEGDEGAFAVLFERHRASVLAVCMGVLSSLHDAEDAAQESFAALAVALRASPPRDLRAWLVRVARNAAIDVARRRKLRVCIDAEVAEDGGRSVDDVSASQGVKHELESVLAGIRELPESQRTALLMRELAGHSYGEIAALLDLDEDAIRGLIARGRIGLRQHREAAELPCAAARAAIATEPDGRRHSKTVRRHVRGCAACRSYRRALRDDAKALKGLVPIHAGSVAGGGALFGGLAAKGALLGAGVAQMTAACAVSVCAVGGIVLLTPGTGHHHGGGISASSGGVRAGAVTRARRGARGASQGRVAASAAGSSGSAAAAGATTSSSSVRGASAARVTALHQRSRPAGPARFTTHGSALGSTLGGPGDNGTSGAAERPPDARTPGADTAPHPGGMAPANGGSIGPGSGSQPAGGFRGSGSSGSGLNASGSASSGGGAGSSPTGSTAAGTAAGGMRSSLGGTTGSWTPGGGNSGGDGGSSAGRAIPRS